MPEFGFARIVSQYCSRRLIVVPGSPPAGSGVRTLLVFNPDRFRGDLEILAQAGFRVVKMPFDISTRFWDFAYSAKDQPLAANETSALLEKRLIYRTFLRYVLKHLFNRIRIDAVVSAAVHYRHDYDWGAASVSLGIPFIVLHRENLVASNASKQILFERMRSFRPFEGSHIVVHNAIMKDLFVRSGYAPAEKVTALGALRMDRWVKSEFSRRDSSRPTVAFFSFGPAAGVLAAPRPQWPSNEREFLYRFCRRSHVAILELARERPDIRVIVKPKWAGDWPDKLRAIWADAGYMTMPPNLAVDCEINAQALIAASDVVVGFNSTVLLEAGMQGKPVVLPLFDEAATDTWKDSIMFHDDLHAFEVVDSPALLKARVSAFCSGEPIPMQRKQVARQLFAKYVSTLEGGAVKGYVALISAIVDGNRWLSR